MVFSSTIFLLLFLPIMLFISILLPRKSQNVLLLIGSLLFYAWGGVSYTLVLLISLALNYLVGIAMHRYSEKQKLILAIGLALNIGMLTVFKYANFWVENFNLLFHTEFSNPKITLPIGISFFTFQAISYLVDLYRKEVEVQKNLLDLSLYIALFPQLIAGPIVRYHDIAVQLKSRVRTWPQIASGIERFCIGLAKKVLIANTFAPIADQIFNSPIHTINPTTALIGAVAYTFQIYFDFAGYSDMAIGLGRMFGFEFKENFNFPYRAQSIQDFWRRWHISLSTWFRDYLYIPLGGNRVTAKRVYFNLFLVFLCTGFWHGASWNFVIWGLFHGLFLVLERIGWINILYKIPVIFRQLYVLLVVITGWIFFRLESLSDGLLVVGQFYKAIAGHFNPKVAMLYLSLDLQIALLVALLSILGFSEKIHVWLSQISINKTKYAPIYFSKAAILLLFLVVSLAFLSAQTYNPFIYFRF